MTRDSSDNSGAPFQQEKLQTIQPLVDELCVNGTSIERFTFIADAAVRIAAASDQSIADDKLAAWSFDTAEALWWELCRRFEDDSVRIEREEAASNGRP